MSARRHFSAFRGRRSLRRAIALVLCLAGPVAADPPRPPDPLPLPEPSAAALRPPPRPVALGRADLRCTPDGAHCISQASYVTDVCRTIEATAVAAGLDRDFFARLIWRESLFDASAISPAGAQGIAQFMPGTARLRRLDDPFNPAKALRASARYLAELRDHYGNLGLAAAAYNAGEERVDDFVLRDRTLPRETRRYVPAITGYNVLEWRDEPPGSVALALDGDTAFQEACVRLAETRRFREFRTPQSFKPWAVILVAHRSQDVAASRIEQIRRRRPVLDGHEVSYRRMRLPSRPGRQVTAQIGTESRAEANALCARLSGGGVPCLVLRN